eukprot:jgi/Tetstr1/436550/TSEL_002705.t1
MYCKSGPASIRVALSSGEDFQVKLEDGRVVDTVRANLRAAGNHDATMIVMPNSNLDNVKTMKDALREMQKYLNRSAKDEEEYEVTRMVRPRNVEDLMLKAEGLREDVEAAKLRHDMWLLNKENKRAGPEVMWFQRARKPFALGAERAAYLARLTRPKESNRQSNDNFWSLKEFREADVYKRPRYDKMLQAHETAAFLADQYNKAMAAANVDLTRLEFVEAVVCMRGTVGIDRAIRFGERFIPGRFVKQTNNTGYVSSAEDTVCTAFSHWTYDVCAAQSEIVQLMVSDVQGFKTSGKVANKKGGGRTTPTWMLTDPCIHCSHTGMIDAHSKDRGMIGMLEYFQTHECNEVCRALNLRKPAACMHEIRGRLAAMGIYDV